MTDTARRTICMFSNLYPPVYSGSSTQCSQLAKELTRRGHNVVVITARLDKQTASYERIDGVHIYRLPAFHLPKMSVSLNFPWLNSTLVPGNARRVNGIFERHKPDVIHLHNHMFDLAFSAVRAARRFNLPLVVTIHTLIKHPRSIYNMILYPLDRQFLKRTVIEKADLMLCPDATIETYVSEAFGPVNKILLPYGITQMPDAAEANMESIRQKYNLKNSPIILSLGHLHEIRNRKELIEILPVLLSRFPNLKLMIVGDIGTSSAGLLAKRLGVSDSVIFTGAVPHSDIPAYLGIADLEAHWFQESNPQNKTLGIAALEAMGAGKPVVGTADEDVYGKGVLSNGHNVILVNLANVGNIVARISDLLADPLQRAAIGACARKTIADHFSWDSVCSQTAAAYECVIEKKMKGYL